MQYSMIAMYMQQNSILKSDSALFCASRDSILDAGVNANENRSRLEAKSRRY